MVVLFCFVLFLALFLNKRYDNVDKLLITQGGG